MNKTANAKDLSENLIIEPANCSGDSFPGDTCPCAALQDALQLIIQLQAKNAAQEAVIQEFARVKAQNAEYRHMLFGRASEKMTVLGKHDAAPSAATDEPPEEIPNSSAEEPAGNPIDRRGVFKERSASGQVPPGSKVRPSGPRSPHPARHPRHQGVPAGSRGSGQVPDLWKGGQGSAVYRGVSADRCQCPAREGCVCPTEGQV